MADQGEDLREEVQRLAARVEKLEGRLQVMANFLREREASGTRAPVTPTPPPPPPRGERPAARPAPKPTTTPPVRDLETLLGTTWLPRLGIGVLVLGAAFFIAYTIEKEWISLTGQIVLGVLGGLGLVTAGEALRRRGGFGNFPAILAAGGLVITYFAVFAAHHFPPYREATGVGLVADLLLLGMVAAGGVGLALRQDAPVLVVVGYTLGYVTVLLSGPEAGLLSLAYVTILAVSLTSVVWWKGWTRAAPVGVVTTWLVLAVLREAMPGAGWAFAGSVVVTAVAFWLAAHRAGADHEDLGAAVGVLATAGASLLLWWNTSLFTPDRADDVVLVLAVVHAAAAFAVPRRGLKGAAGVSAAVLAFVWAPLAMDGAGVTVAWSLVTAGFAAFGLTTRTTWARAVAFAAAAALFIRVVAFDPNEWMPDAPRWGLASTLAGTAALATVYLFAARAEGAREPGTGMRPSDLALGAAVVAPLGYLAARLAGYAVSVAWAVEGVALVVAGFAVDRREVRIAGAALLLLVAGRVLFVDLEGLDTGWRIVVFLVVGALLLGASLLFVRARREP